MKSNRALIGVIAWLLATPIHAADAEFMRQNVIYFLQHSSVTADIRILSTHIVGVSRDLDTGRVGLKTFEVAGEVIQGFKGIDHGKVVFQVTQEAQFDPPDSGEFIVSLNRNADGSLVFADFSVMWVSATPELLFAARLGK